MAAEESRAPTATSCSCRARSRATGCERVSSSASAAMARRACPSSSTRRPTGSSRGRRTRVRRGRCCRTSASSRRSRPRCVDALERLGGFDRATVEPIVPAVEQWHYRNKLEYSFGAGPDGRARARLPPAGQLAGGRRRRRGRARVGRDRRAPPPGEGLVRERGAVRVRPRVPLGVPSQPRGARGQAHREAAGPARHEPGRLPHGAFRRGGGRGQRRVEQDGEPRRGDPRCRVPGAVRRCRDRGADRIASLPDLG